MSDYGDCKGCKRLVIYEDGFGCDAQHDLCDDVCQRYGAKDGDSDDDQTGNY